MWASTQKAVAPTPPELGSSLQSVNEMDRLDQTDLKENENHAFDMSYESNKRFKNKANSRKPIMDISGAVQSRQKSQLIVEDFEESSDYNNASI